MPRSAPPSPSTSASVSNLATVGSAVSSNGIAVLANMTGAGAPQTGAVAVPGTGPDADAASNAFSALATSGAGGSQVGVSGALAVNVLDSQAIAQVSPGVSLALSSGAVVIQSNDLSTATAIAMPATAMAGSTGGQLGVGASIALNLVSTTSTAALSNGVNFPAPGSLTLDAEATHAAVTQAAAGAAGGIAVTPVVAISLLADQTSATIGALTAPITAERSGQRHRRAMGDGADDGLRRGGRRQGGSRGDARHRDHRRQRHRDDGHDHHRVRRRPASTPRAPR